jgi:hypothetical protein
MNCRIHLFKERFEGAYGNSYGEFNSVQRFRQALTNKLEDIGRFVG